jgi:hypothetical protein
MRKNLELAVEQIEGWKRDFEQGGSLPDNDDYDIVIALIRNERVGNLYDEVEHDLSAQILAYTKHGDRVVEGIDLGDAAAHLIQERIDEGYWYDDGDQHTAEMVVAAYVQDESCKLHGRSVTAGEAAWWFLSDVRGEGEYEGVELV